MQIGLYDMGVSQSYGYLARGCRRHLGAIEELYKV